MMVGLVIKQSNFRYKYTSTGRHSGYQVELTHEGLGERKSLSGVDRYSLQAKVDNQKNIWENKWTRKSEVLSHEQNKFTAEKRTQQARSLLLEAENTLKFTLDVDDAIDWSSLKRKDKFSEKPLNSSKFRYNKHGYPLRLLSEIIALPAPKGVPIKANFKPQISFIDKMFGGAKKKISEANKRFNLALTEHAKAVKLYESKKKEYEVVLETNRKELKVAQKDWESRKVEFEKDVIKQHKEIDHYKNEYLTGNTDSVIEYCELVLSNSTYSFNFEKYWNIVYNEANKILALEYLLPRFDDLPKLQAVNWVKSRSEFQTKRLSQTAQNKLFESVQYQIVIRTLHELFEADVVDVISMVTLNGLVDAVNPATGHTERKCILSIQASKEKFEIINLQGICDNLSYKDCFKALKGVAAAKLSSITPIQPIIEFDKTDRRFSDHYEVTPMLNSETNLAAMNWEDFEHLIREVFGKEFSSNGGEVKVTQASRDGGVDAIAFDPDPIRGGKIVIQAKRYTNVVGVSAVRDLYGTVMNEGATKGILVTTAQYGPDSYEFAKGKPLTLLDGSHLLHLLEKHGHKAKIDIAEAKLLLKE